MVSCASHARDFCGGHFASGRRGSRLWGGRTSVQLAVGAHGPRLFALGFLDPAAALGKVTSADQRGAVWAAVTAGLSSIAREITVELALLLPAAAREAAVGAAVAPGATACPKARARWAEATGDPALARVATEVALLDTDAGVRCSAVAARFVGAAAFATEPSALQGAIQAVAGRAREQDPGRRVLLSQMQQALRTLRGRRAFALSSQCGALLPGLHEALFGLIAGADTNQYSRGLVGGILVALAPLDADGGATTAALLRLLSLSSSAPARGGNSGSGLVETWVREADSMHGARAAQLGPHLQILFTAVLEGGTAAGLIQLREGVTVTGVLTSSGPSLFAHLKRGVDYAALVRAHMDAPPPAANSPPGPNRGEGDFPGASAFFALLQKDKRASVSLLPALLTEADTAHSGMRLRSWGQEFVALAHVHAPHLLTAPLLQAAADWPGDIRTYYPMSLLRVRRSAFGNARKPSLWPWFPYLGRARVRHTTPFARWPADAQAFLSERAAVELGAKDSAGVPEAGRVRLAARVIASCVAATLAAISALLAAAEPPPLESVVESDAGEAGAAPSPAAPAERAAPSAAEVAASEVRASALQAAALLDGGQGMGVVVRALGHPSTAEAAAKALPLALAGGSSAALDEAVASLGLLLLPQARVGVAVQKAAVVTLRGLMGSSPSAKAALLQAGEARPDPTRPLHRDVLAVLLPVTWALATDPRADSEHVERAQAQLSAAAQSAAQADTTSPPALQQRALRIGSVLLDLPPALPRNASGPAACPMARYAQSVLLPLLSAPLEALRQSAYERITLQAPAGDAPVSAASQREGRWHFTDDTEGESGGAICELLSARLQDDTLPLDERERALRALVSGFAAGEAGDAGNELVVSPLCEFASSLREAALQRMVSGLPDEGVARAAAAWSARLKLAHSAVRMLAAGALRSCTAGRAWASAEEDGLWHAANLVQEHLPLTPAGNALFVTLTCTTASAPGQCGETLRRLPPSVWHGASLRAALDFVTGSSPWRTDVAALEAFEQAITDSAPSEPHELSAGEFIAAGALHRLGLEALKQATEAGRTDAGRAWTPARLRKLAQFASSVFPDVAEAAETALLDWDPKPE